MRLNWLNVFPIILILAIRCGHPGSPPRSGEQARSAETSTPSGSARASMPELGDAAPVEQDVDVLPSQIESDAGPTIREIPECTELVGADGCTGVGAVMLACVGLGNIFEESVTRRLIGCLQRHQGTFRLCQTSVVKPCVLEALETTAVKNNARTACDALFARCPASAEFQDVYTRDVCVRGLSSLLDLPRQDFIECMHEHCELRLCVGHLL